MRQDYAKNRKVAEAFYQHALRAVRDSELPVLEVTDAQQRGSTFGARLANAFADAFAQGYEHVIAVGSDCPRLHEVDWQGVAKMLEEGRPVLGPTPDEDGAYLIGMTRGQFDWEAFAALPWTSADLFSALEHHLSKRAAASPTRLPERDDVNTHEELVALVRKSRALPHLLLVQLRDVLGGVESGAHTEHGDTIHHVYGRRSRAPPPLVVASERKIAVPLD